MHISQRCQQCQCAGCGKNKAPTDKLCLLAVECLEELFKLGKTLQGVATLLQDVPTSEQEQSIAADTGMLEELFWWLVTESFSADVVSPYVTLQHCKGYHLSIGKVKNACCQPSIACNRSHC